MFVVCEKWMETRKDCYIDRSSCSTIAVLLPHLGWVAQPWSTEGRKALSLQAGSHFSILSPTDSNRPGTWLYYFLKSTCFHCSSAYLHMCISWLIDGQYITNESYLISITNILSHARTLNAMVIVLAIRVWMLDKAACVHKPKALIHTHK